jgi:hypothetical protein
MSVSLEMRLIQQLGISLLLAVVATALLTPVLLVLYRRRVSAQMARKAGEAAPAPTALVAAGLPALRSAGGDLRRRSRAIVAQRARAWFLGFAAQALLLTLLFAVRYANALSAPALLLALVAFLLPAGLVLFSVISASGWTRLLVVAGGLLLVLSWPGLQGEVLRSVASLYVGLPLLPLLLFQLRFWRGAAAELFLLAFLAGNGWMLAYVLARDGLALGEGVALLMLRLLGLLAGLAAGLVLLRALAARYARGRLSEQSFNLSIWWLLYSLVQATIVVIGLGAWAGLVALVGFALGRSITSGLLRRRPGRDGLPQPEAPRRLLLLRVFGNSWRSERLFEQLVQAWTPLGSIELIGGTDLALTQVTPLDFLAFLTGRLRDRFGQSPAETAARLAAPITAAADGSYPARQTFCHADVWEATMRRMLAASDAVVMDLRQFRHERSGCRVELAALARSGSHRPIVLVTDASTDLTLARQLLEQNGADPDRPPWRFVSACHHEAATVDRLLDAIAGAA